MYSTIAISPDIIEIVKPLVDTLPTTSSCQRRLTLEFKFLSHLSNWGLFGALSVQSYIYHLAFPSDRWFTKAVVAIVYAIELVQTILVTRLGFDTFGYGWGDPAAAIDPGITWLCFPIMTSIVSFIIQLYYAWRVWMLSRSKYIPLMICVLSLFQLAGGLWAGILGSGIKSFSYIRLRTHIPLTIWLVGTAACDILITVSMLQWLFTNRSDFASTNAILAKLIRLTFETGLLTSTVAVVDIVLFLGLKHKHYYVVPNTILPKLYSNSLMVLLNSRLKIGRNRRDTGRYSFEPGNLPEWLTESDPSSQSQRAVTTYHLTDFSASGDATTGSVAVKPGEARDTISEGMRTKADESHNV